MTKMLISTMMAAMLIGCESLPTSVFPNNSTFNNKDIVSCEGSFQCRIIELPALPGCATPSGYKAFSTKALDSKEVDAYQQSVMTKAPKGDDKETCPMVYPAQALCVENRCEAITLGK